jgi:hypothetical protein
VGQIHLEHILENGNSRGNGVGAGDRGDMFAFVVAYFNSLNNQLLPGRDVPGADAR